MKKIIYLIAGLFIFSACQTTPCECKDSSNGFVLDGVQAPYLTLTPGRTYRFDVSLSLIHI